VRAADLRRSARRVALTRIAFLLAFAVLGLRAAHLSVFEARGAARGEAQTERILTLAPERGSIFDRHGSVLALTVEAPSVFAVGREVEAPVEVARALSRHLGLDRAETLRRLEGREGFQFLRRWVRPEQVEQLMEADLRGVGVLQEPRRIYPHRELVAPVVGFANIDGAGVRGIEQQEDAWLRGVTRRVRAERDARGKLLVEFGATAHGTAGGDVALTLDATLQAQALGALAESVKATGARGGMVIALDPHSGEILTLAEWPGFDPNQFRRTNYSETGSRAFHDAVEPGSAMKAFLAAAALELGAVDPRQTLATDGGSLKVPGKLIRDHHDFGPLNLTGVLTVSSNVGSVLVAQAVGRSDHFEMLRAFGFGAATGSRFPDESAGVLRPWQKWKPLDHATIAFGQGVSVTGVQLATAMAALANGGLLVRPHLVAGRRSQGGPWQWTRSQVRHRVTSRRTAERVLGMLENAVIHDDGTGSRAALRGVRVAGKTGTAQKWDAEAGRYSDERYRAWFVGTAPVEAPRVVIVVQLDEPERPHHTGGMSAAPLFAKVAEAQLARWGVFPEPPPTRVARAEPKPAPAEPPAVAEAPALSRPVAVSRAPAPSKPVAERAAPKPKVAEAKPAAPAVSAPPPPVHSFRDRVLIPDFRGMPRSQVAQVTQAGGLRVELRGEGVALSQDPPPGSVVLSERDTVKILFGPSGDGSGGRG